MAWEGETPSDVQPGQFGCNLPPAHGSTYVGMVTRDNYTWEGISQKLSAPLDSGVCYTFTIQLATSPNYISYARRTRQEVNYNLPVVFQMWGGYANCDETVLLAESPVINHRDWRKYHFTVRHLRDKPLTHITFQVHYPPGKRCIASTGNLLMDDLSEIAETTCPTDLVDSFPATPVVNVLVLKSEAELDERLFRELSQVRYFAKSDVQVQYQCEEGGQGRGVFQCTHLLNVAAALRQFPKKRLILRVKYSKTSTREPRVAFLKNYLLSAGLPESQIEVMSFDKEEKGDWKVNTSWLSAKW